MYGGVIIFNSYVESQAIPIQMDLLLLDESPFQLLDSSNFLLLG